MALKKLKEKTRAKKEEKKSRKPEQSEDAKERDADNATTHNIDDEEDEAVAPEPEPALLEKSKQSKSKKRKMDQIGETTSEGKNKKHKNTDLAGKTAEAAKEGQDGQFETYDTNAQKGGDRKQKFIVFVGNLPYSVTTDSINKHFEALKPFSLRLSTDKKTKKPKGFAFLEFEHYDRMKTCLKLYHHSSFDDKISPPRKINVELTAGGGGNTDNRKQKLKEKNERLTLQRRRRMEQETKRKHERGENTEASGDAQPKAGSIAVGAADSGGIHPSRLRQIKV